MIRRHKISQGIILKKFKIFKSTYKNLKHELYVMLLKHTSLN